MRKYKIAFAGLGSIAKRHLGNVCSYLKANGDAFEIDLYRSSISKPLPEEIKALVSNQYLFVEEPQSVYDAVFVTNPTSMHYGTLEKFKNHSKSFFIEKPVFDSTQINESIFSELEKSICYVACPLRYTPVLQYVKENISLGQVISARAISSSYLPDWRPGQDYRECYSAKRSMGGGVGIDLIHEWDYLTYFFGMPDVCHSIQDKISELEIDSDDIAIYIAKTKKTAIELHLDYFGRKSIRTLDLFLPDDTVHCDILNGTISYQKENKTVNFSSGRNAYQMTEIEHFFNIINGTIPNDNTVEHAFEVLKLTKGDLGK